MLILKRNKILFLLFLFTNCNQNIDIGLPYNNKMVPSNNILMSSSANISKSYYYNYNYNGILYEVITEDNDEKRVSFIMTKSTDFITSDGYKIGDTFASCITNPSNKLYHEIGWGYFIKLKSGWNLFFTEYDSNNKFITPTLNYKHELGNQKALFIFKYKIKKEFTIQESIEYFKKTITIPHDPSSEMDIHLLGSDLGKKK